MTARCATCKHWTITGWTEDGFGECRRMEGSGSVYVDADVPAVIDVQTKADFGCVLHEPAAPPVTRGDL